MKAFAARAPIPIPTHAAAPNEVAATSAVDVPCTAILYAAASSVVVNVDAFADAFVSAFVDATSGKTGKTYERAFYILMRIMCTHSLMLPLVL